MRLASSRDGKTIDDIIKIETPSDDVDSGINQFCEAVEKLKVNDEVTAVGGGIAGVLNKDNSILVHSPNISGWIGYPLKENLQARLGAPVVIENDTAVVGLGEAIAGAGTPVGVMAYVTVSTGVGGVRIVDGQIDRSTYGFEIGHQYIDFDRSYCADCPEPGDFESYISGKSLEIRYGKKAYELTDTTLWEQEAKLLAVGLANTIMHWSPEVVVLGGSMVVGTPSISVDRVREYLKEYLLVYPELPEIREASCGDVGGLSGALALIERTIK